MYKYTNYICMYIYISGRGQVQGGECFPVPAPSTFGDKILSLSQSPKIAPHPRPKPGGSPRCPFPADNIVIPNINVLYIIFVLAVSLSYYLY